MSHDEFRFYDGDALLYRLHAALEGSEKDVVFVLGAPITAPFAGGRGVADVDGVIQLIRAQFSGRGVQLQKLDKHISEAENAYQAAFDFLSGRAGQDAANKIIKRAVAQALASPDSKDLSESIIKLQDDQLRSFDNDVSLWHLSPAVDAVGALIAKYPQRFGSLVVTSNFDPLLEVAIRKHGGSAWRTSLAVDGSIFQSEAPGCQVVHIHGYWHGTDTLHTNRQLLTSRPALTNDFLRILQNKIVVVIGYGGWQDIFTGALSSVVSNDNLFPEVLWGFHSDTPVLPDHLLKALRPGIDRNRVSFYRGIDCHRFFPELLRLWENDAPSDDTAQDRCEPKEGQQRGRARLFRLAPLECDRPPNIDVWVGREKELRALETSNAKVVIICGMGGEGKSALASHYIDTLGEREGRYRIWDWRDCKEQSDRIRTQVVEIIVRFSNGSISSDDLAEADDIELVEVLIDQSKDADAVLVFDNVDSYVDLENKSFTGLLDLLVQRVAVADFHSRLLLTCRPDVHYSPASVITFSMKGISASEAIELFSKRAPEVSVPEADIRDAHAQTKGHAFWLDLLAVQLTNVPGLTLRNLLDDMRRGREDVPDVLSSIWDKLAYREKTLLRLMAEAVRPETENTIAKFANTQLNYKNFNRAFRSLISLNLIVVKPESDAPDLYDLHPLVRQFVRTKFAPSERMDFIRVVINQYKIIIGAIESLLGIHLPYPMLERWSQKAELEVSAGLYDEAFETLTEVEDAFIGGGHLQEYVRVARLLFEAIEWETAASKYKRFDQLVGVVVAAFDQLGDFDSADSLISHYQETIPQKTARYIKLCDIKAYSKWLRGDFEGAIEWAKRGVALKEESDVDTAFDCKHTLALAQRDSGNPELALETFLEGWQVEDLTKDTEGVPESGPLYGNVGRCLQFMNRLDEALICFKKSMRILEHDSSSHSKSNRAYARTWVGQVFASLGDTTKSEAFLMDAIRVLGNSAPFRVRQIYSEIEQLRDGDAQVLSETRATTVVDAWMRQH